MSAQTTYSQYHSANYPGQLVGDGPKFIDNLLVETAAGIAPGKVVGQGTADDQCVLGAGTGVLGIVVRNLDVENNSSDAIVYAQKTAVDVISQGDCIAYVGETGSKGDLLNVVDATGVIGVGVAGASETQLNAILMETLTVAGNAHIRLFPQVAVPVVVDGVTVTGSGVIGDPLVATAESGAVADGSDITGSGTTLDPLTIP